MWFNPPFRNNVPTNTSKRFLILLDIHFLKPHRLHKIFNHSNVKIS